MDFDVIILGGGVNGTGTARDCAMRGLRVLLLEKADYGVGASGNSSGMIHGGIRYMLSDRHVTALACRDSGPHRIAPHLLFMSFSSFTTRKEGRLPRSSGLVRDRGLRRDVRSLPAAGPQEALDASTATSSTSSSRAFAPGS